MVASELKSSLPEDGGVSVPREVPRRRMNPMVKGCLIFIGGMGALAVLAVLFMVVVVALAGGRAGPVELGLGEGEYKFHEITIAGRGEEQKLVCIPIAGIIATSELMGIGPPPVDLWRAQIRKAENDQRVQGLVLVLDSPGGEITASDILYQSVRRYRERTGKPVVACMMGLAASGAYYVASAADRIVAHPTTITGSIGVLMPLYDVTGLMDKIGVKSETVKSVPLKDMASPFSRRSDEQKKRERQILEAVLDEMHQRFVKVVAEGRALDIETADELADGRIFTGEQALQKKLVDKVGYREDAIEMAMEMAKLRAARVVRYKRVVSVGEFFGSIVKGPRLSLDLQIAGGLSRWSRPMYLWVPEAGN